MKSSSRAWLPFVFCYRKHGAARDSMCSAESAGEGKTRKGQPDTSIAKTPLPLMNDRDADAASLGDVVKDGSLSVVDCRYSFSTPFRRKENRPVSRLVGTIISLGLLSILILVAIAKLTGVQEQALASIIGGGLAGGALTILYNWLTAKQEAIAQEKATIAALAAELAYIRRLCDSNARLQPEHIAPFIKFPTNVIVRTAFQEPHFYPLLDHLRTDLETLTLGIIQVNQLIDFRAVMWNKPTTLGGGNPQDHLDDMRNYICHLCSGKQLIPRVGSDSSIELPSLTDHLIKKIETLGIK
jgi:hypothetical protein